MIEALGPEVWYEALPDGWLTRQEAECLAELASGRRVLEVGSWLGRSTVAMARTAEQVVAVDHHQGPPYDGAGTLDRFLANLHRLEITNVVPVLASSEIGLSVLEGGFEMAFIDGNHEAPNVIADGRAAARLVRLGAPVVFHDYGSHEGVTSAVHDLAKRWDSAFYLRGESLAIFWRK